MARSVQLALVVYSVGLASSSAAAGVEFSSEEVVKLRRAIGQRHHFHVISHRLQLSGLCWECAIACPVATMPPVQPPADKPRRKRAAADG